MEIFMSLVPADVLIFVLFILLTYTICFSCKRPKGMPPGPHPWPIVGNLFQLGFEPYKTFMDMSKQYGPIFSVNYASFRAVILNDADLIKKCFNDPAFLGRPKFRLFIERSGGGEIGRGIVCSEHNMWSEQRRFVIKNLRDFGYTKQPQEMSIQEDVRELNDRLRENSGKPIATEFVFLTAVLSSLWKICTGEQVHQDDKQITNLLQHMKKSVQYMRATGITFYLPGLTKLAPEWTGYTKTLNFHLEIFKYIENVIIRQKESYQENNPRHLLDTFFQEIHQTSDSKSSFYGREGELNMVSSIMDLFQAGVETTSTTLCWTFLILALHPEIQEKLHNEIVSVVGNSRVPCLDDKQKMPYTECVILEVLRFSAVIPLGVYHRTTENVSFEGYLIPKHTIVTANLFGVLHDPAIWGDPESIRPERFLLADGSVNRNHEALIPFSVGKRDCLGQTLAKMELFLFLTGISQRYRVEPDPSRPKPTLDFSMGIIASPKPHHLIFHEIIHD